MSRGRKWLARAASTIRRRPIASGRDRLWFSQVEATVQCYRYCTVQPRGRRALARASVRARLNAGQTHSERLNGEGATPSVGSGFAALADKQSPRCQTRLQSQQRFLVYLLGGSSSNCPRKTPSSFKAVPPAPTRLGTYCTLIALMALPRMSLRSGFQ